MFKISLVNMPFSSIEIPSIALTQLQSIIGSRLGARASAEVCYASHDACRLLGIDDYRQICNESSHSGLGDWLFRPFAFPGQADTSEAYQHRYFPAHDPRRQAFDRLLALGPGLGRWLDGLDRAALPGSTRPTWWGSPRCSARTSPPSPSPAASRSATPA